MRAPDSSPSSHGGPWTHVVQARVPQPVLAVPVTYYRIPPGHAKRMDGPRFEHRGKGKQGGKHDERTLTSAVGGR